MRLGIGAERGLEGRRRSAEPQTHCAQAAGRNPYPHKFHVSLSLPEYVKQFSTLGAAEQLKGSTVSVAGALPRYRQAV